MSAGSRQTTSSGNHWKQPGKARLPAWHGLTSDEVVAALHTDADRGISPSEAEARLAQFGPNISLTPYLTFSQDITGWSADFSIQGGRITYGGGFRADIRQTYFVEASALWYRRGTPYDPMRDRGQYTIVVGYNLR